jgi:hypothetical protein
MEMKYLLIAAALSLGFSGTCLAAQSNQPKSSMAQASTVTPQYPFAAHSQALRCSAQGHRQVCKPV